MNAYFKITPAPNNNVIDALFKSTQPVFVSCQLNLTHTIGFHQEYDAGAIRSDERNFFTTNPSDLDMLGKHFYKLLAFRNNEYDNLYGALKREWTRDSPRISAPTAVAIAKGNAMETYACRWAITVPDTMSYETRTVDTELRVTAWIWACELVIAAYNKCLSFQNHASDSEDSDTVWEVAVRLFRKAATLFSFLAMRGMKEGSANFDRLAPVFTKSYVCKAYEAMCLALAHVTTANPLILACKGGVLEIDAVAHTVKACELLNTGYRLLKNVDGADDAGIFIPENYHYLTKVVYLFSLFYRARLCVTDPQDRPAAMAHMRMIIKFPELAHVQKEMKVIIDDFDSLTIDSSGRPTSYGTSPISNFFSAVTRTLLPAEPNTVDGSAARLVELGKLPPLSQIQTSDIDDISSLPVESLLFRRNSNSN